MTKVGFGPFFGVFRLFGGRFYVGREKWSKKKTSISQNSEAMAVTRRLAPSFFEIWATHQNPLKSVRYEGFAGGLKKKVVVDILVVAFMSAENPARPRPGQAWPGCAPLWLPHSLSVASTEATRCAREAREAREGRAARAKV